MFDDVHACLSEDNWCDRRPDPQVAVRLQRLEADSRAVRANLDALPGGHGSPRHRSSYQHVCRSIEDYRDAG